MRETAARAFGDLPLTLRYSLADALLRHDLAFEASEVLERYVNLDQPEEVTTMFLGALASARRDGEFIAVLDAVGRAVRNDLEVMRIVTVHAYNTGDLKLADATAGRFVKAQPGTAAPVLLQLAVLARRDKRSRIRAILANILKRFTGADLGESLKLARYQFTFGDRREALKFVYRLSFEHHNDHRALMAQAFQTLEATSEGKTDLRG